VGILVTWCLDAYNATIESALLQTDTGFVTANNQYSIYPITIAACIVGVFVWLIVVRIILSLYTVVTHFGAYVELRIHRVSRGEAHDVR
jgi:hypothetical protein